MGGREREREREIGMGTSSSGYILCIIRIIDFCLPGMIIMILNNDCYVNLYSGKMGMSQCTRFFEVSFLSSTVLFYFKGAEAPQCVLFPSLCSSILVLPLSARPMAVKAGTFKYR